MRHCRKYCTAGQATDDNMAHALSVLDTQVYKHTLRICNTYCVATVIVVRQRCLHVTLYIYVYLLSCLHYRRQMPFRLLQCRRQHNCVWAAGSQFVSLQGQTISPQHQAFLQSRSVKMIQAFILSLTELNVFLTVRHELTIINYQLDALIIIYS